jgi:hypothetical protein
MKALRRFVERKGRLVVIGISVFAILYGVLHIVADQLNYENYWGGVVFAPFTIVFGLIVLYVALFRYNRAKPAGRDRKGRRIRFPADDYRKW